MRRLTAGNKKVFTLFTIIIIGIIALLILCLTLILKIPKEEYIIEDGNFLYDENYNPIILESDGLIEKKWTGSYYLMDNGTGEEYELGSHSVAYQPNSKTINLYGNMYRVYMDGAVSKLSKNNTISRISEDQLYKLGDRKYMVIGNTIVNQTGALSTENYLLILLDKAGNTYLLNNELNSKTIKPMIIRTQTFEFDVANEKLIYQENEIDLKKIIGSTNNYVEIEEENNDNSAQLPNMQGQGGTTIIQNNNNQTNIENNEQTNIQNNYQNNQNINISDSNNNDEEKTELSRSVNIKGTSVGANYIDVEYQITDPENKYQTVYLLVDGGETTKTIALDKEQTNYRITGLEPNKEYKITLAVKQVDEEGITQESIEDIIVSRTVKPESSMSISKITKDAISFNIKIDKNQGLDEAEIVLYIDGEEKERTDINIEQAMSNSGWNGTMPYSYGNNIVLKVENAKSNNENISFDLQAKAKIY